MSKKILLSFDIEEFDLPEEYNQKIDTKTKLNTSLRGLNKILNLLEKQGIKATFFVTAFFAEEYPEVIKKISQKHEIASHGLVHSSISARDIFKSKKIYWSNC